MNLYVYSDESGVFDCEHNDYFVFGGVILIGKEQNEEWKYVKAADRLSAYIKCIEESKMGNTDFVNAQNSIKKSIDEMKMPEIAFFIEKFLPSYSITLDEIN